MSTEGPPVPPAAGEAPDDSTEQSNGEPSSRGSRRNPEQQQQQQQQQQQRQQQRQQNLGSQEQAAHAWALSVGLRQLDWYDRMLQLPWSPPSVRPPAGLSRAQGAPTIRGPYLQGAPCKGGPLSDGSAAALMLMELHAAANGASRPKTLNLAAPAAAITAAAPTAEAAAKDSVVLFICGFQGCVEFGKEQLQDPDGRIPEPLKALIDQCQSPVGTRRPSFLTIVDTIAGLHAQARDSAEDALAEFMGRL
ncbi:hypothetical protein ACSSS7_005936 [Eimeria intestinalis]